MQRKEQALMRLMLWSEPLFYGREKHSWKKSHKNNQAKQIQAQIAILLYPWLFHIRQKSHLFFHHSLSDDVLRLHLLEMHHWDTEVHSNPIQPGIYTTLISLLSKYPTELHYH